MSDEDEGGGLSTWSKVTDYVGRGASLLGPWASGAAKAGGLMGKAATAVPWIGGLAAGANTALEGAQAYQNFSKDGISSDEGWNNVGGTILGGAGVALAFAPPGYGAALAAGQIGADLLGAGSGALFGEDAEFSASNMVGGYARGMFGDRSWGYQAAEALGGGTLAHIGGQALNVVASPIQSVATVGSGIANYIGNVGSGIANGEGLVGRGVHAVGSGISSAASAVGGAASSVGSAIVSFLSDGRLKDEVAPIRGALDLLTSRGS